MWKLGAGFLGFCSPEISNNKPQLSKKKKIKVLDLEYMAYGGMLCCAAEAAKLPLLRCLCWVHVCEKPGHQEFSRRKGNISQLSHWLCPLHWESDSQKDVILLFCIFWVFNVCIFKAVKKIITSSYHKEENATSKSLGCLQKLLSFFAWLCSFMHTLDIQMSSQGLSFVISGLEASGEAWMEVFICILLAKQSWQ